MQIDRERLLRLKSEVVIFASVILQLQDTNKNLVRCFFNCIRIFNIFICRTGLIDSMYQYAIIQSASAVYKILDLRHKINEYEENEAINFDPLSFCLSGSTKGVYSE